MDFSKIKMSNRIVEIDSKSGFCFGVVNAVKLCETNLADVGQINCLGDIVHNDEEVNRLQKLGMNTVSHSMISELKNKTLLIRAHGEPPSTYKLAQESGVKIIDATCPVVLKLQNRVKIAYAKAKLVGGTVLIYGKKNHAEVNGLVGQTNNEALVIESAIDLEGVDFNNPIFLFSQTTKSIESFNKLVQLIESRISRKNLFEYHDTICRQVSNRVPLVMAFAKRFDLVIFVGGKKSSNSQVLYSNCKLANQNSHFVSEISDVDANWFTEDVKNVGICGATSTPLWLMEEVANKIRNEF